MRIRKGGVLAGQTALTRVAVSAVLFGAFFAPRSAFAQEWLKDRRFSEGPGYKTGDFELHPSLGGEVGYDSNYFLRTSKTGANLVNGAPSAPVEGAGMFRLTPALSFTSARSAQRTEGQVSGAPPAYVFSGGVAATYRELFGSKDLSDQRNVSGNADLRFDILPGRAWGGDVFANYVRTIQPTVLGAPDLSFNSDNLGVGGEIIAQPDGGTLDWRLGYQVRGALFESSNGSPYDHTNHSISTRGRWKFRPRTALFYDGSLGFNLYSEAQRATTTLHDATPVRARLGLTGLVTDHISLLASAGWASSFFRGGASDPSVQQFDSLIAQAQVTFYPNAGLVTGDPHDATLTVSSISLGYARDYSSSYFGDFFGSDRGYAKVAYFFAGRALISLEGGVGAIEYPDIYANNVTGPPTLEHTSFTDIRVDGTLFAEYRFLQSVGVNLTFNYQQNFSSTQIPIATAPGGPAQVYDLNWQRIQAFLGVRWFM